MRDQFNIQKFIATINEQRLHPEREIKTLKESATKFELQNRLEEVLSSMSNESSVSIHQELEKEVGSATSEETVSLEVVKDSPIPDTSNKHETVSKQQDKVDPQLSNLDQAKMRVTEIFDNMTSLIDEFKSWEGSLYDLYNLIQSEDDSPLEVSLEDIFVYGTIQEYQEHLFQPLYFLRKDLLELREALEITKNELGKKFNFALYKQIKDLGTVLDKIKESKNLSVLRDEYQTVLIKKAELKDVEKGYQATKNQNIKMAKAIDATSLKLIEANKNLFNQEEIRSLEEMRSFSIQDDSYAMKIKLEICIDRLKTLLELSKIRKQRWNEAIDIILQMLQKTNSKEEEHIDRFRNLLIQLKEMPHYSLDSLEKYVSACNEFQKGNMQPIKELTETPESNSSVTNFSVIRQKEVNQESKNETKKPDKKKRLEGLR